jgi:hypothetical protein
LAQHRELGRNITRAIILLMEKMITVPWLKALSGLFINLSAGWFAAVVIVPNFSPLNILTTLVLIFLLLTYITFRKIPFGLSHS